jgi:hypothetical protein
MSQDRSPLSLAAKLAFVAWCLLVGTLLMYAPWLPVWSRWTSPFAALELTGSPLPAVLAHPAFRGAVSGFGLYHLVWATHDLDSLLGDWLRAREARRGA